MLIMFVDQQGTVGCSILNLFWKFVIKMRKTFRNLYIIYCVKYPQISWNVKSPQIKRYRFKPSSFIRGRVQVNSISYEKELYARKKHDRIIEVKIGGVGFTEQDNGSFKDTVIVARNQGQKAGEN